MSNTKTYEQLTEECARQVVAVYQYYTDQQITDDQFNQILVELAKILPRNFTTVGWSTAADRYDVKVAEEN